MSTIERSRFGAAGMSDDDDAGATIRPMTADDLPVVMAIELVSYTMPWSEATFRGLLRRKDAELLVAEDAGRILGYAAYWCVLDQAELGNVAVRPEWRGRGLGAQLIRAVFERAERRGIEEIFLEVRPSNESARELYERMGFEAVGRRRNYYARPVEDAIVMKRIWVMGAGSG